MKYVLLILFCSLASAEVYAPGGTATDATIQTSDITTNNASPTKHGWLLKLENTGAKFLRDDGTWQAPAGSGDMVLATSQTVTGAKSYNLNTLLLNGTTGSTWLNGTATGASATFSLPSYGSNTLATVSGSETLLNKTVSTSTIIADDSLTTFQDNLDPTKKFKFNGAFLTTGTTRELIIPDDNGTIACVSCSQILTNKTVSEATVGNFLNFPTNLPGSPAAGFGNLYYSGSTFRFKNSAGTIYRFSLNEGTNTYTGINEFQTGVSFTSAVSMTGGGFLGGNWAGSVSASTVGAVSLTGMVEVNPTVSGVITVNDDLVMSTSKTVSFPNSAAALGSTIRSRTLYDVQVGSWSPTAWFSTSQPASVIYSTTNGGFYTKIDDMVCVQGLLSINSMTASSGAGNASVSSMPFVASASGTTAGGGVVHSKASWTTNGPDYMRTNAGERSMALFADGNTTDTAITKTNLVSGTSMHFSGCYNVK